MKGRRKHNREGLLTSILCDASDGLTLSERDKLSDHQNEGVERPEVLPPRPQTSRDWRQTGWSGRSQDQARSQTAPGQGLDVRRLGKLANESETLALAVEFALQ